MMNNSTIVAKKLLAQLKNFLDVSTSTEVYNHTSAISDISRKLHSMKLKDEFLLSDLSDDERRILDIALVISIVSK